MSSEFSILFLVLLAAYLVTYTMGLQRIEVANDKLGTDQKELAEFVYREKRKKFGTYNFMFLMLFFFAVGYLNRYFVFIGLIVMIYGWKMRSIFVKEIVNDYYDMNFSKRYIGQFRNANKILYFASFLVGMMAMIFTAYAYY